MIFVKDFFINIFGYYSGYMLFCVIVAMFFLFAFFYYFYNRNKKYKKIKSLQFYDIIWRWKWKGKRVVSLWCYCPDCNSSLVCDDEYSKLSVAFANKRTFFLCKTCGNAEKAKVTGGDRRYVLKCVESEIYKKVFGQSVKNEF